MTLVVADAARSFVMHHKPESLGMGIGIESIDVEIRIRGHEIEDIVLAAVGPVLPADVPAFDQDCIKTVLRSEVDVLSDIVVVGAVPSVRFRLRIVDRTLDSDLPLVFGIAKLAKKHEKQTQFQKIFHFFDTNSER